MKSNDGSFYIAEEIRYIMERHYKKGNLNYNYRTYEWEEVGVLYFVVSKVKAWVKRLKGY